MKYEIFVYIIQMWDNFMSNTLLCIIPIVSNLDKKRLNKSKGQWILYIPPRGGNLRRPRGVQVKQDVKNK
jgi:hypothetical protein